MADTSATLTVRQLADLLILKNKFPRDEFFLIAQHIMDGYRTLRLFHLQERIRVKATVDSLNRITLPTDCVKLLNILVPVKGVFTTLTRRDELVDTVSGTPPNEYLDPLQGEGIAVDPAYLMSPTVHGGLNRDGLFVLDEENRTIHLNNPSTSTVVLEYISSGVSSTDTYLPIKAQPAIEMFVMWKYNVFLNPKMAVYYEEQYDRMVDELRVLELPTLDELADAIYRKNSPLPQR